MHPTVIFLSLFLSLHARDTQSDADSVLVHVISNIDAAAMKHGNNSGSSLGCSSHRCNYYHNTSLVVWKCLIILTLINKSFSIR